VAGISISMGSYMFSHFRWTAFRVVSSGAAERVAAMQNEVATRVFISNVYSWLKLMII